MSNKIYIVLEYGEYRSDYANVRYAFKDKEAAEDYFNALTLKFQQDSEIIEVELV